MSKINMLKMNVWTFWSSCALSTLYLTVLGIIIPSLKSVGQFCHTYIKKTKKPKIVILKMDILTFW